MRAGDDAGDPLALTPAQTAVLSAAKTWWLEGERQLDYLAEQAGYQATLALAAAERDRFRAAADPLAADAVPLIRLARRFAPNVAVNRSRETDAFAASLHDLLFGVAPLAERVSRFLHAERGAGALTVSHFLFLCYPDRYPFVRRASVAFLAGTAAQKRAARVEAAARFGACDGETASLLADFVLFDLARRALILPDFADLDAVIRHAGEMPKEPATKRPRPKTRGVREADGAGYAVATFAPEPAEADLLRYLEASIAAQGFIYPPLAARNYYLSLKTKPFVIVAGLSGTGKTRLTELFAEALTGNSARYRLLAVRPDWTDPSPLLGYHNALTGAYIGTPFLELLREAARAENARRAYFVCLDEMNLARAEHYLADILSAMETRTGEIALSGTFDAVRLSPNVFLSGTINVEEGTYPFGVKVLDRANVIEFAGGDLSRPARPAAPAALPPAPPDGERLFLARRNLPVADAEAHLAAVSPAAVTRFYETLAALNDQLSARNLPLGYRVRDESLRYLALSFAPDGTPLLVDGGTAPENAAAALDFQILQKVLPRVSGTAERLEGMLARLRDWADENGFPGTAAKVRRMIARAADEGIVSFWE